MEEADQEIENGKSYSDEQHKLSLMRALVEHRDPTSKDVDDLTLRRFLRARNLNVENASAMFFKYQKWKKTFIPNGIVLPEEIQYDLSQNKAFIGGQDKKGCPILVGFGGRHYQNPKPGGLDEFKCFVFYTFDKICARIPDGQEKFLVIVDLQEWGYSNSDVKGYIGTFSILQDCFPERLEKLFIVNASKLFMTMWKIVYPFIDNNTRTKIQFVEKEQLNSTLLEIIDESQLPDIYGGKFPLVPIQDA